MTDLLAVAAAALVAAGLAWRVAGAYRAWALARALLDVPNARSSHSAPTPRGGGVGIVVGFLAGLAVWLALGGGVSPRAIGWLAGALLVAGVSFVDDLRSLPALPRLAAHLAGAGLLALAGVQEHDAAAVPALALAFLWVVAVTNIYNFMDGIDGLATGQAIVAGLAFALAGALGGNPLVAACGTLVAAAAAGFLPHNWPPARLFMGDVGSTFLGFTFAALPLLGSLGVGGRRLPFELGALALAPFLFDGLLTLARRMARGERWFEAHRSHYYQRLVGAGVSHGRVAALYVALAVAAALVGLTTLYLDAPGRAAALLLGYLPSLLVVRLVWQREPRQPAAAAAPGAPPRL